MATAPERREAPARSIVRLQPARPEHVNLVLAWRNDPAIWAQSGTHRPVTVAEHHRWWGDHAMDAAKCRLWLIRVDSVYAGAIRFDRRGSDAVVSIYLAPDYRSQGHGRRAFEWAWAHRPSWAQAAVAEVRADNPRGQHFFATLGFSHVDDRPGNESLLFRRGAAA